jgi:hypothetical protein
VQRSALTVGNDKEHEMRRRVLMGIGSIALGLGSVAAVSAPASAALPPLQLGGNGCFLFVNLGIIPPIAIGCPA